MRNIRPAALAFLIGLVLNGPLMAGPYEDGIAALEQGSFDTAIEILLPLAEDGNVQAQTAVADAYIKRRGYNDDTREAEKWLRLAAEQGYAPAQSFLGWIYTTSLYENESEAMKWFRLAAEQGHAPAQMALGSILDRSPRGSPNREEAFQWYRRAADQGYVSAYLELSSHYRTGRGVPKNLAEAVKWERLAAEQGHIGAYLGLARMYQEGEGVPQDNVQAYMWYDLAQAQGDKSAVIYRDTVAARMTEEQIAEAQRLAREWTARHQQ